MGRRPFDPALLTAAAPVVDRTLAAFSAAVGASRCEPVADVCVGPDSYPSAEQVAGAVTAAGIPDVRVRPATSADTLAPGSTLVGARPIPGGCVLIAMGSVLSALTVGVLEETGECLEKA